MLVPEQLNLSHEYKASNIPNNAMDYLTLDQAKIFSVDHIVELGPTNQLVEGSEFS